MLKGIGKKLLTLWPGNRPGAGKIASAGLPLPTRIEMERKIDTEGFAQDKVSWKGVHDTEFFRLPQQMEWLTQKVMPAARTKIISGEKKEITIWSAGSSYIEPYSIAITLLEDRFTYPVYWDSINPRSAVKIIATDTSPAVIELLKKGTFDQEDMRSVSHQLAARYFVKKPGGTWQIKDEVKSMVIPDLGDLRETDWIKDTKKDVNIIFCNYLNLVMSYDYWKGIVDAFGYVLPDLGWLFMARYAGEAVAEFRSLFTKEKWNEIDRFFVEPEPPVVFADGIATYLFRKRASV